MNKSLFKAPEGFALSPLLNLLPVRGSVHDLEKLSSSLYARFEKVQAVRQGMAADTDTGGREHVAAEEAMLKVVLEWLAVNTDSGTSD